HRDGPGYPATNQPMLVGIELPADRPWPPTEVPAAVVDLGVVDNRPQRTKLLDYLQAQTPIRMLMICDAQQTPDRGVIALLADLAGMARHSRVALLADTTPDPAHETRTSLWQEKLLAAGFAAEAIHTTLAPALDWLAGPATDDETARNGHAGS
ncbi:MAG TPA: DUF2868 domain-containing protein, partial [Pusillimonas sp.]